MSGLWRKLFILILLVCSCHSLNVPGKKSNYFNGAGLRKSDITVGDFLQSLGIVANEGVNHGAEFTQDRPSSTRHECNLPSGLVKEIAGYQQTVNTIINAAVSGVFKGRTWRTLAKFVDTFGSRIAGSQNLENAIDYMVNVLKKNQLENVHTELALVPHWVRGNESLNMVKPRYQKIALLGLGSSVGTPAEGLTAQVLVVSSFDELHERGSEAKGKIVVFNEPFVSYGKTVAYRDYAAVESAKLGAVASLIRSVTPFSINSPHTGWQDYEDGVKKIPTAAISVEAAQMLHRMFQDGEEIWLHLYMEAKNLPDAKSRNTVAEIVGREKPDQVVVVSGHLDSWDVGQGAMDDGGGAFISWNALALMKLLGLRPRRTVRSILWTAEEEGLVGAQAYFQAHSNETKAFDFVMESDEGTFKPLGLSVSGNAEAACIVQEILKLLKPINATQFSTEGGGSDIVFFLKAGVPGASLINANEKYFWFHHSDGDMMTVEDPANLDLCTAVWTAAAFVVADLSVDIPRD